MICQQPKTPYVKALDQAKLKMRIDSNAVVLLVLMMICNFLIYMLLLPCLVSDIIIAQF